MLWSLVCQVLAKLLPSLAWSVCWWPVASLFYSPVILTPPWITFYWSLKRFVFSANGEILLEANGKQLLVVAVKNKFCYSWIAQNGMLLCVRNDHTAWLVCTHLAVSYLVLTQHGLSYKRHEVSLWHCLKSAWLVCLLLAKETTFVTPKHS